MVMKNTDRLEEFVKTHREAFDQFEPSAELWNKIQVSTKKGKTVKMRSYFIKVAAVVAIALLSSVFVVNNYFFNNDKLARITDPELKELLETEEYYAQQVNVKLLEIKKCYLTFPDIKADVENDLNELETMYNSLKSDLKENISNKTGY